MKLSEDTIEIMKNFAVINPALQIRKGSVLTTISPSFSVFATTRVVESFPSDCIIGDLNKFLSKLTLYKDAELEFTSDRIVIKSADGRHTDTMKYGIEQSATLPPKKKIELDDPEQEVELSQEDLQWQRKSAGISDAKHMVFMGDGKKFILQSNNMSDDSSDVSHTILGTTKDTFRYVVSLENWKMLDGTYSVKLKKGLTKFVHKEKPVQYFIATDSKFTEST